MQSKNPFQEILADGLRLGIVPQKTKKARDWYRTIASSSTLTEQSLLRDKSRLTSNLQIGDMVFFRYDAKHKDTLPYWDAFPLIFPFQEDATGFYGINLHYLPPQMRSKIMDTLYTIASDKRYDDKTKVKFSYDVLRSVSTLRPAQMCVKRYLKNRVASKFIKVNATEWDIALFLPISNFQGASEETVWRDIRRASK